MLEKQTVSSVSERDIDFVLLEELTVSEAFRVWMASQIGEHSAYESKVGVWHSVTDGALGESDLILIFATSSGEKVAVLIENKIDAAPQPEQGERYHKRGLKGVSEGHWNRYVSCLIAPESYLQSEPYNQVYDTQISYESVQEYFSDASVDDERLAFKAMILREGIEQNRRGYKPVFSDVMTNFVANYHKLAVREFPELKIEEAKPRPAGSTWVNFLPNILPQGAIITHQLSAGMVKLFLKPPHTIDSVIEKYGPNITAEMSVEQAGKSIAIILKAEKIDAINVSFEQQEDQVRLGLSKAGELLKLLIKRSDPARPIWMPE